MCGTGRRGDTIVDGTADRLLKWKESDSGIVFPSSGVQGWLAGKAEDKSQSSKTCS
jgi:hypothetical protein